MRIMEAWSARVVVTRFMDTQCSHHVAVAQRPTRVYTRDEKQNQNAGDFMHPVSL